jgi:SAM-dependent methyltransferase
MNISDLQKLTDWLIDGARSAASSPRMMAETCERMVQAGLPLWRVGVFIQTLHPDIFSRNLYERYVARHIVGPWARLLVDVADVGVGERVLDVACGTGVVARAAAERVGSAGRVIGVDLNSGMIAVARSLPIRVGASIEWVERRFTLDHLSATPLAPLIAATEPAARERIGAGVMKELQRYADGEGVTYPEETHVLTARVS